MKPITWHKETEVLVVGFGGAGAVAAIEAHDAGAEVLIIEKAAEGGGTAIMAGGCVSAPREPLDVAGVVAYLVECGKGRVAGEMAKTWAREAAELPAWIQKQISPDIKQEITHPPALTGGYHPDYTGHDKIACWRFKGAGEQMFQSFEKAVRQRNIEIIFNTAAKRLVAGSDGEVLGLVAERDVSEFNVRASKAVILCCGGFGFNEEMKTQFFRCLPKYATGNPACTGDGILMGQAVGGAVTKVNDGSTCLVYKFPEYKIAWVAIIQANAGRRGCIIVNRHGKRFANEELTYDGFHHALEQFDPSRDEYPNIPAYTIFDEASRPLGAIAHCFRPPIVRLSGYKWSGDNLAEIEKGWIKKGETIRELAEKLNIPAAGLEETLTRFNGYCDAGHDLDFGRRHGLIPLKKPPYYGLAAYPGFWDTAGGLKINPHAQVLNVFGEVIPRLYAAGTTANATVGFYYPIRGHCLGDGLTFGRLAGRNAALE